MPDDWHRGALAEVSRKLMQVRDVSGNCQGYFAAASLPRFHCVESTREPLCQRSNVANGGRTAVQYKYQRASLAIVPDEHNQEFRTGSNDLRFLVGMSFLCFQTA